jgi:hypothetical protein
MIYKCGDKFNLSFSAEVIGIYPAGDVHNKVTTYHLRIDDTNTVLVLDENFISKYIEEDGAKKVIAENPTICNNNSHNVEQKRNSTNGQRKK